MGGVAGGEARNALAAKFEQGALDIGEAVPSAPATGRREGVMTKAMPFARIVQILA